MRIVVMVCLVVGCGGPQSGAPSEAISNANAVKQPSRDAFVEDIVQALSAGDADRLVALVDWKGVRDRALICDGGARSDLVDDEAAIREHARKSAANAKGLQMTFVELDRGKNRPRRYGGRHKALDARLIMKGDAVGECTARTELLLNEIDVKVRITRNGKTRDSRVRVELLRADGKWFLTDAPHASAMSIESAMEKMEEFRTMMCSCKEHDSKCAQAVTDEMTKWAQELARSASDKQPDEVSPEDAQRMADVTRGMGECSMKAMTPAGP